MSSSIYESGIYSSGPIRSYIEFKVDVFLRVELESDYFYKGTGKPPFRVPGALVLEVLYKLYYFKVPGLLPFKVSS